MYYYYIHNTYLEYIFNNALNNFIFLKVMQRKKLDKHNFSVDG